MVKRHDLSFHQPRRKSTSAAVHQTFDHSHVWSGLNYSSIFSYETNKDQFKSIFTYGSPEYATNFSFNNNNNAYKNDGDYNDDKAKKTTSRTKTKGDTLDQKMHHFDDSFDIPTLEIERTAKGPTTVESLIVFLCYALVLLTLPFSLLFVLKRVNRKEKLVVFRFGHAKGRLLSEGIFFVLPCIDKAKIFDDRQIETSTRNLQITTEDKACIELNASAFYSIKDFWLCASSVNDYDLFLHSLFKRLVQSSLPKKYAEDFERKLCQIEDELKANLNSKSLRFGVEISKVKIEGIKILKKPESMGENLIKALLQPNFVPNFFGSLMNNNINVFPTSDFLKDFSKIETVNNDSGLAKENGFLHVDEQTSSGKIDETRPLLMPSLSNNLMDLVNRLNESLNVVDLIELRSKIDEKFFVLFDEFGDQKRLLIDLQSQPMDGVVETHRPFIQLVSKSDGSLNDPPIQSQRLSKRPISLTFRNVDDFLAILTHDVDPSRLILSQRLKIDGDLSAARRLRQVAQIVKRRASL